MHEHSNLANSCANILMGQSTVAIIGGGALGLSIAWHLLEHAWSGQLLVLDNADPLAPSRDITKFVRVDYSNAHRMTRAIEARGCSEADRTRMLKICPSSVKSSAN